MLITLFKVFFQAQREASPRGRTNDRYNIGSTIHEWYCSWICISWKRSWSIC